MLYVEKKCEKTPMKIELDLTTPLGVEVEKIFDTIKKIDELRNPTHEIHLKINCCAF